MTARADAVQANEESILDAATVAFLGSPFGAVTLGAIARESGVSVQTVIRRFGSKEGLFEAVAEREGDRIRASRQVPESAGFDLALGALLAHYEADGDGVLHLLSQEHRSLVVARALEEGRAVHRAWVERHCAEVLAGREGDDRELAVLAAFAATDLGTWRLLRRDFGLDQAQVASVMTGMVNGLKEK